MILRVPPLPPTPPLAPPAVDGGGDVMGSSVGVTTSKKLTMAITNIEIIISAYFSTNTNLTVSSAYMKLYIYFF